MITWHSRFCNSTATPWCLGQIEVSFPDLHSTFVSIDFKNDTCDELVRTYKITPNLNLKYMRKSWRCINLCRWKEVVDNLSLQFYESSSLWVFESLKSFHFSWDFKRPLSSFYRNNMSEGGLMMLMNMFAIEDGMSSMFWAHSPSHHNTHFLVTVNNWVSWRYISAKNVIMIPFLKIYYDLNPPKLVSAISKLT